MFRTHVHARKARWPRLALTGLAIATVLGSPIARCVIGFAAAPMAQMASCHEEAAAKKMKGASCCELTDAGAPQPQVQKADGTASLLAPLAWLPHPADRVLSARGPDSRLLAILNRGSGNTSPPSCSAFSVLLI